MQSRAEPAGRPHPRAGTGPGRSGAVRGGARLLQASVAAAVRLRWRRAERCCGRWASPPFCCPPCLAGRPDRRSAAASARWAAAGGAPVVRGRSRGLPARRAFRAAVLGSPPGGWIAARRTSPECRWLRCAQRSVVAPFGKGLRYKSALKRESGVGKENERLGWGFTFWAASADNNKW